MWPSNGNKKKIINTKHEYDYATKSFLMIVSNVNFFSDMILHSFVHASNLEEMFVMFFFLKSWNDITQNWVLIYLLIGAKYFYPF